MPVLILNVIARDYTCALKSEKIVVQKTKLCNKKKKTC